MGDDVVAQSDDTTVETVETTPRAAFRDGEPKRVTEDTEFAAAARRFVKALGRRAGSNINTLSFLAGMSELVDEMLTQAVHDLRAEPVCASWAEIGHVLGMTRQAAQQRFGGQGARTTGGQAGDLR